LISAFKFGFILSPRLAWQLFLASNRGRAQAAPYCDDSYFQSAAPMQSLHKHRDTSADSAQNHATGLGYKKCNSFAFQELAPFRSNWHRSCQQSACEFNEKELENENIHQISCGDGNCSFVDGRR
jgi:hypothetical protein